MLILSAHSDYAYVEQMVSMGAAGYILKHIRSGVLAKAIREVEKGNTFFSPSVAKRINGENSKPSDRKGDFKKKNNRLSSREIEVLQLIAEGKPNKQVAAELGVSFKTVDKHRQHLMGKLNIHDIAGLTRYAISEGIIENSVRITIT
jgi:DNA-binding NarL/FixJ family response regulator